jgi:hypothetical protein
MGIVDLRMKNRKLEMLAVLGAARALVVQSKSDGWPDETPSECATVLDQMMAHAIDPEGNPCPPYAGIQFAPTGPIQEIAISNGWHDSYMELSEAYDGLVKELGLFEPKKA